MQRTKSAVEVSLKVVNVVGILDQKHGHTMVTVNGRKEKRCSMVPGMTCEEHFNIADYAFLNGFPSSNGQVFVCVYNNQGKRPNKPIQNPGAEGYIKIVEEALAKIDGPTISKPDYDAFMVMFEAAKAADAKKDVPKSIEILLKASKYHEVKLARMAEDRLNELNSQGEGHVAEAQRIAAEDPAKARESLRMIASKYAPLACAQMAADLLKKMSEKGK